MLRFFLKKKNWHIHTYYSQVMPGKSVAPPAKILQKSHRPTVARFVLPASQIRIISKSIHSIDGLLSNTCHESKVLHPHLGCVYTDVVSFLTESILLRLHLALTRHRSRLMLKTLPEVERFQNYTISLVMSTVENGETASI